jgi:hypothetical protein
VLAADVPLIAGKFKLEAGAVWNTGPKMWFEAIVYICWCSSLRLRGAGSSREDQA